ncbi:MAG: outer membrane beta-barrel protein [Bacteroidota bacterium]
MKKFILACCLLSLFAVEGMAQSYAFGVKGGMTVGFQRWNNGERDPLIGYHGITFIETAPEGNEFALFAQLGYHLKGGAIRQRRFTFLSNQTNSEVTVPARTDRYEFHNLSLTLGGKQKYDFRTNTKVYYLIGIRGDYTFTTNLDEYEDLNNNLGSLFYPVNAFVREFNFGATIGGGFEFLITDLISGIVEITVNPDFSRQYMQPPLQNVIDPFNPGNSRTIPELNLSNNTLELTVGLRFLHEIEYIDTVFW